MTGLIIFGSLLIGMFMGLPVCFALLAACLIYLIPSGIPLTIVPQTMIAGMNSFVLLAIPLFTMTGYLMEQTSLSRRLVDFVEALFCRSRGSMGVVTIVTCAIFAALTGSGPATVAAIGAIMMPALTRANYPKSTSAGMIAAGGALGPIIPPSANMVVYGAAMGLSVSKMFIGGVLPGIMMAVALCLVNVYLAAKYKFAKSDVRYPKKEVLRRTARAIPTLVLPVIILGGIYGGLVTPTEAAVLMALLFLVGCLMDTIPSILILAPILVPVGVQFGLDELHLGVLFCITLTVGFITPPFGINLFTAVSTTGESYTSVVKGVIPFMIVMIICVLICAFVSPIITFLPGFMMGT